MMPWNIPGERGSYAWALACAAYLQMEFHGTWIVVEDEGYWNAWAMPLLLEAGAADHTQSHI